MSCDEQQTLRDEEIRAWTAYKQLEHSGRKDADELQRRGDKANLASSRLHQHISRCPQCQPNGVGASAKEREPSLKLSELLLRQHTS